MCGAVLNAGPKYRRKRSGKNLRLGMGTEARIGQLSSEYGQSGKIKKSNSIL